MATTTAADVDDNIIPTIVAAETKSATSIDVTFSEQVTSTTTTDFNDWSLSKGTVTDIEDINATPDTVVTLTVTGITTADTPNVIYTDTAGDVKDTAAGNLMISQTFTGTTDGAPPVFTVTTPTSSSSINDFSTTSSDITWSVSETLASGTITITNTGGAAGGGGTCTLGGTALASGAHNNFELDDDCSTAVSLNNGGIYKFDWDGEDLVGNTATQVSRTSVTFVTTPPTFDSATTVTTITLTATFSEDLDDATVASDGSDFTVSDHTVLCATELDGVVTITLSTTMGTAETPTVTLKAGESVTDQAGNPLSGPVARVAADGIPPTISSITLTNPTTITVVYSEEVTTSGTSDKSNWAISGGETTPTIESVQDISGDSLSQTITISGYTGGQVQLLYTTAGTEDITDTSLL